MKKYILFSLITIISFCAYSQSLGTVGKIFTKEEANQLYGPVLKSKEIPTATLQQLMPRIKDYIMFKMKDDHAVVLDDKRNVMFPPGISISSEEVVHLYSKSVLQELLNKGKSDRTTIEMRSSVMTVTNGASTMEVSFICPPVCPD